METTDSAGQVRVVLTGLEDDTTEGVARFARDLSQTFEIPMDKAEVIATTRPFTVKKACRPEAAERLAHTLARLGALYRIEPVAAPVRPTTIPSAMPPAAAAQSVPVAGEAPSGVEGMESIPLAPSGGFASPPVTAQTQSPVIPVAPTVSGGPILPAPQTESGVSGEEVACTECGTVQPADRKACENCYFPLARRPVPVQDAEEAPDPGPTTRPEGVVAHSNLAAGYGDLQQCAPTVFTAAALLFTTAIINLWSVAFLASIAGPSALVTALIDIGLGIGLLKGSRTARTWILVRAVIGGILWGIVSLGTGDIASFMFQEMYSVSLIVLLVGHGSLLKGLLVGIPNLAVFGLAVLGLTLVSLGGSLMAVSQAEILAEQGDQMQQAGRYDQAITLYKKALNASSSEDDHLFQAVAYRNLGAAYMGKEDFVRAIPELQASAALNDGEADTHYLLGMAYFQIGQEDMSLEELLRVKEIDPHYPNLESSIEAVAQVAAPNYRY